MLRRALCVCWAATTTDRGCSELRIDPCGWASWERGENGIQACLPFARSRTRWEMVLKTGGRSVLSSSSQRPSPNGFDNWRSAERPSPAACPNRDGSNHRARDAVGRGTGSIDACTSCDRAGRSSGKSSVFVLPWPRGRSERRSLPGTGLRSRDKFLSRHNCNRIGNCNRLRSLHRHSRLPGSVEAPNPIRFRPIQRLDPQPARAVGRRRWPRKKIVRA